MSLRGGYQIINLDNREFSTEQGNVEKYEDIYKNLLNSHAKFIVLSGLNMDGIKWGDREAIFYELQNGDGMYFQAELRRIWNTANKTCTTKYINIYPNDTVKMTVDTFIYEPDNDKSLNDISTNAVENKVIYNEFRKVYYNDGSQRLTAPFNMGNYPKFTSISTIEPYQFRWGNNKLANIEAGSIVANLDGNYDNVSDSLVMTKGSYKILDKVFYTTGVKIFTTSAYNGEKPFADEVVGDITVTRHNLTLHCGFGKWDGDIKENSSDLKVNLSSEIVNAIENIIGCSEVFHEAYSTVMLSAHDYVDDKDVNAALTAFITKDNDETPLELKIMATGWGIKFNEFFTGGNITFSINF